MGPSKVCSSVMASSFVTVGVCRLNFSGFGRGSVASISPAPRRAPVKAARDTLMLSIMLGSVHVAQL